MTKSAKEGRSCAVNEIRDDHWNRLGDQCPRRQGDPGITAKDNRLFINPILETAVTVGCDGITINLTA